MQIAKEVSQNTTFMSTSGQVIEVNKSNIDVSDDIVCSDGKVLLEIPENALQFSHSEEFLARLQLDSSRPHKHKARRNSISLPLAHNNCSSNSETCVKKWNSLPSFPRRQKQTEQDDNDDSDNIYDNFKTFSGFWKQSIRNKLEQQKNECDKTSIRRKCRNSKSVDLLKENYLNFRRSLRPQAHKISSNNIKGRSRKLYNKGDSSDEMLPENETTIGSIERKSVKEFGKSNNNDCFNAENEKSETLIDHLNSSDTFSNIFIHSNHNTWQKEINVTNNDEISNTSCHSAKSAFSNKHVKSSKKSSKTDRLTQYLPRTFKTHLNLNNSNFKYVKVRKSRRHSTIPIKNYAIDLVYDTNKSAVISDSNQCNTSTESSRKKLLEQKLCINENKRSTPYKSVHILPQNSFDKHKDPYNLPAEIKIKKSSKNSPIGMNKSPLWKVKNSSKISDFIKDGFDKCENAENCENLKKNRNVSGISKISFDDSFKTMIQKSLHLLEQLGCSRKDEELPSQIKKENNKHKIFFRDSIDLSESKMHISIKNNVKFVLFTDEQSRDFGFIKFAAGSRKAKTKSNTLDLHYLVIFGALLFKIEGKAYNCQPGSLIQVLKGTYYSIRNHSSDSACLYFVKV